MAGDWIKLESATPDKPEVTIIAELLGIPTDQAVGILVRFWVWLDRNSRDGSVTPMSRLSLDSLLKCPGFSAALEHVGWLKVNETLFSMTATHYDRHNGSTAKSRANARDRQGRYRDSSKQRTSNADTVTKPSPEKRREVQDQDQKQVLETRSVGVRPALKSKAGIDIPENRNDEPATKRSDAPQSSFRPIAELAAKALQAKPPANGSGAHQAPAMAQATGKPPPGWQRSEQGILSAALVTGTKTQPGESWEDLTARIFASIKAQSA